MINFFEILFAKRERSRYAPPNPIIGLSKNLTKKAAKTAAPAGNGLPHFPLALPAAGFSSAVPIVTQNGGDKPGRSFKTSGFSPVSLGLEQGVGRCYYPPRGLRDTGHGPIGLSSPRQTFS